MKMEIHFITSFLIRKYYNDPYMDAMIKTFNLGMPNQNMKPEEVKILLNT